MPVSMGTRPRHLEELRLGGGYNSNPDGGSDFDRAGNIQSNGDLDIDGSGNFGSDLTVSGGLSVGGLDTTWRTYLPANMGIPDPSLPCGPVTPINWRSYQVVTPSLAFDPNAPQAAFFQFRLPKGYDGRPLNFTLEWSATAGTAGDVRWGVNPLSFVDASPLSNVGSTTYTTESLTSVNLLHIFTINAIPISPAGNAMTTLRIVRLSNDVSDTFPGNALLLGVGISM